MARANGEKENCCVSFNYTIAVLWGKRYTASLSSPSFCDIQSHKVTRIQVLFATKQDVYLCASIPMAFLLPSISIIPSCRYGYFRQRKRLYCLQSTIKCNAQFVSIILLELISWLENTANNIFIINII